MSGRLSFYDVNSADDQYLYSLFIKGPILSKLFANMLSTVLKLLRKNGVLCIFCNLNVSFNITLWTSPCLFL